MPVSTRICDLLDIEHPILLAPMAGVSGGALAQAVSAAGGLGLIGGGYGNQDWLQQAVLDAGNTRVGIGFITWALEQQPHLLDLALDHDPAALFLSFGELAPFAARIKDAGVILIAQVQNMAQARDAMAQGADIIVAQGTEAGGHGGAMSTMALVPAVVDAVGAVPVVAAGGIGDGRGLAASLLLGAQGVLCGTAFYASTEALTHDNAKTTAIAASGDDTARSSVFDTARGLDWPGEWNLRALSNQFSTQWQDRQDALAGDAGARHDFDQAARNGDTRIAPVIVGEGVGLVHSSEPAAQIVARMVSEAEVLLRQGANILT